MPIQLHVRAAMHERVDERLPWGALVIERAQREHMQSSGSGLRNVASVKRFPIDAEPRALYGAFGEARRLQRGDYLFHAGERCSAIFLIESGWFKASNLALNGDEQVTHFYRPSELLGLEAVSAPRYVCTAFALEHACVRALSIPAFHELCQHSPNHYRTILELVTLYIGEKHEHILMLGQKTASERLARFIYDLIPNTGKPEITLSMPREAIASYLGIALETVSRLLHQFERENLIRLCRRRIRLIDQRRLRELAYGSGPHL